jgi:hypothetical protein
VGVNRFITHLHRVKKSLWAANEPGLSKRSRDKALTKAAQHMVSAYHGVPYAFALHL